MIPDTQYSLCKTGPSIVPGYLGNIAISSIEFVNTYAQNYCRLVFWPLGTGAYAESSPVTTDDASYFSASWLSINASAADFP